MSTQDDVQQQINALQQQVDDLTVMVQEPSPAPADESAAAADPDSAAETTANAVDDSTSLVWPPISVGAATGFGWGDAAGQEEWVALADWVDWFRRTYDVRSSSVLETCWPQHPGVVEELAALWMAWCGAAEKSRGGDLEALVYWHDRYLPGFLTRFHTYEIHNCDRRKHNPPVAAPRLTDRSLIDVRETAISAQLIPQEEPTTVATQEVPA